MSLALTRWQRTVATLSAGICLGRSAFLFQQDEPAGTAFIAGAALAMVALTPPVDGEAWFPNPLASIKMLTGLKRHWRKILSGVGVLAIMFGAFAFRQNQLANEAQMQAQVDYENWQKDRNAKIAQIESVYAACMKGASLRKSADKTDAVPFDYVAQLQCNSDKKAAENALP